MKRKYNLKKPLIKKYAMPEAGVLPESVDLESQFPPVFDQGQESSCTGNGWAGIWSFFELKALKEKAAAPEEFSTSTFISASRQFIYYCERARDGDVNEDAGSQIATGAWVLSNVGCCDETIWPYSENNWQTRPSPAAYLEATNHKIPNAFSLNSIADIKSCLADGFPIVLGIEVFSGLESDEAATTGMVPMPSPSEESVGGHCIVIVGYDESTKKFKLRNSWGTDWGKNGYFFLDYQYIQLYGSEFMTLRK